jgi:hypothetical protein
LADSYEQKPKTWSLFPMSDDDIREKEDFYHSKGWDVDKVPTYSGKLILPDGTLVRIEGRVIQGNRGKFFAGGCYIPEKQPNRDGGDRRSDRDRDDRSRDRDRDAGRSRDDDRRDRPSGRDDRRDDRSPARDDRRSSRDLDDDVPF